MADIYKIILPNGNEYQIKDAAVRALYSAIDTRLSDVEDVLANIDFTDTEAAIVALALRVAALESHALLDSGYPNIITPAIVYDSTDDSLSIS